MMKVVGYLICFLGIVGLAISSIPQLGLVFKLPNQISTQILFYVSIGLSIIGIILVAKGGGNKIREVPIYQGKEVVGFRRIKK